MRACTGILILTVLAVGCIANQPEPVTTAEGRAEIRVDAGSPLFANITRLAVETSGQSHDLVLNPVNGTFDAALVLPSGTHVLVARAFNFNMIVGESTPIAVDVQAGVVTRVLLKILDLTGTTSIYGPIVDSLSYPTTVEAGASATFTISVVAPAGDPVTYSWSSDCPDSTFSTPGTPTTSWSRTAEGPCTITASAVSNGIFVAKSFVIVVFPAGSESGAVTVNSRFFPAPSLQLSLPGVNCVILPDSNASCPDTIASPATTGFTVSVYDWGAFSTPGTLELSDNCGGRFGTTSRDVGFAVGNWIPPLAGGLCILTAQAVNADGVVRAARAAIVTHAGSAGTAPPPGINASLNGCQLTDSASPEDCTRSIFPAQQFLNGSVSWGDGLPGSLAVTDTCVGTLPDFGAQSFFGYAFTLPNTPGATCTTTVRATNLQGASTEVAARYQIPQF